MMVLTPSRSKCAKTVCMFRSLPKSFWLSLGGGYGTGSRSYLDGEKKDTRIATFVVGATLAMPLARRHSLQLNGTMAIRSGRGPDFDAISLIYQYSWGGGF